MSDCVFYMCLAVLFNLLELELISVLFILVQEHW